ncbi:MAG TPA: hypothetical protein DGG95_17035, partial [Cytophagales bacterium]|nr:hypothetical protein [Cytophagales bacterium]
MDLFFTLIMLVVLSGLLALIVLMYVFQFQFPVFFKQQRIGRNNVPFTIFKFRTLLEGKEDNEARRFWWGDVLRFLSLDELPQLWNVLRGEMSLIGPRPLPIEYLPLMNAQQRQRHQVRPGITGWTQVNG